MAYSQRDGPDSANPLTVCPSFILCILSVNYSSPGQYTVGASSDSGYEYLLKQYLLSGDAKALTQCALSIH